MNYRPHRTRAGFTLLETMLAAAVGALVVFACVGMFFMMDRTDRAMEARARDQAELERLRFVMERSFSTLLMSDEPRNTRPGELSVATPAEDLQAAFKDVKPGGTRSPGATDKPGGSADRFGGTERFGSDRGGAGKSGGATRLGARTGDKGEADAADPIKDRDSRSPGGRTPPPPRLILASDAAAPGAMIRRPFAGDQIEEAQAPQRLELVLFQSPVPTDNIDPVDLALNSVRRSRSTLRHDLDGAGQGSPGGQGAGVDQPPTGTDQQADAETLSAPVRAVRGAFEIHPQPLRGAQIPGGQVMPAALQDNPSGLWQVWWVPLARLDATGSAELSQDTDVDAGSLQPIPKPFLVASNLRYVHWTVFHERERKPELSSIWSGDLPAYVEVEAQTAAGLTVNWMFEVDWANGPEVPRVTAAPGGAGGASKDSDKAGGSGGEPKSGQPSGGAGASPKGTK